MNAHTAPSFASRARYLFGLLGLGLGFVGLPASSAEAQCPNGAIVCANVQVSGSVTVGATRTRQVPPPPPRGRVLVVQSAPVAPPRQQVVVVQQQPPVIQEEVIVIEQAPARLRLSPVGNQKFGLSGRIGGILAENVRMGGFAAGIRFRPSRIFGVELNVGAYGGTDYNGNDRVEVPVAFDFMFHLPRASRFQVYLLAGPQVSWASVDRFAPGGFGFDTVDYVYFGGHAGVGGEWRLSDHFALSADIRGFIRSRVDDDGAPEFVNFATGETSNTSAGGILNVGAHLYF